MKTIRIIDRTERLNEDGSPRLDQEGNPIRAASWSTYVLKYLVDFDQKDGEGTQPGEIDAFGDEVAHASYGAWSRTWEIRRYSTFGVARNLTKAKLILRQPKPDDSDRRPAAQAWRASRAGDYWRALSILGHFEPLTDCPAPAPASHPVQGVYEDKTSTNGRPYRTLTAVVVAGETYYKTRSWDLAKKPPKPPEEEADSAEKSPVADRPDCPREEREGSFSQATFSPDSPDIPFG
jgi:hypothetical protein